jgi:hypothetical protein
MGGDTRAPQKAEPTAPPAQSAPVQPLPSGAPAASASTPDVTNVPPPSSSSAPAVTLERKSEASSDEPVTKKTWFWVVVGAGVLAAGAVAVLLLAKGSEDPAMPSIGRAGGN